MEDNQIFRIALITAIIGLAGMTLLSDKVMPHKININEISKSNIGETVVIEGHVRTIESHGNKLYILSVIDNNGVMNVIIKDNLINEFKRNGQSPQIYVNRYVRISGKVIDYKGSIELELTDVKSINILI
ncbi:OB-fold nucleic acid binding domain-containing protein [Methanobacterium oryzae]|uniref:OB-fold nucleic acid binding domain-containing protein n=1 Tax=Methanobacterium oryzae TaxID=69540 RepID=UPI003D19426C